MNCRPVSFLLLAVLVLASACTQRNFTPEEEADDGPVRIMLDEPFELALGQTAFLEDVEVTFAALRGDNRCPADVTCLLAGEAVIELHISRTGESKTALILSMPGLVEAPFLANASIPHRGFDFKLMDVGPYPLSTGNAASNQYRILLRLNAAEAS